ncbi:glycosyltransferase family 4 protein [Carboxydothermus ferrireducens]|uniref:Glycosyltransferase involved in cell wall biosynthesis n=1 Tax=Carboxydothermus ferrireducens DSM 11255 TaxID=1119529 RepID=A0ABX2R7P6_9THEO|nr:glycosyltransferase family 1 protein [Carboxydothermus ferrireducens]NYE56949.1 glycosyltransferase involved in cell wall biosynthesis [Carboxydothermus ferrireducens DSM 11255]
MNIYLDCSHMKPDTFTGIQVFTLNFLKELSKNLNKNLKIITQYPELFDFISKDKILVLNSFFRDKKNHWKKRFIWFQFFLPYLLKKDDILISASNDLPYYGSFKKVVVVHDVIPLEYPNGVPLFTKWYFKYNVKFCISKSDLIFTVSEISKKKILKYTKIEENKIKVIPPGVNHLGRNYVNDDGKLNNIIKNVNNYFLIVNPNLPHKNFKNMILAFLNSEICNKAKLIVVGELNFENQKLIQNKNNVIHYPKVSNYELQMLYKNSIAVINCSFVEGFSLVPFEAALFEKPSIVSFNIPPAQYLKNAVLECDPNDILSMATAINKMYYLYVNKPEEYRKMGSLAKNLTKELTWENYVKKFLDELLKLF